MIDGVCPQRVVQVNFDNGRGPVVDLSVDQGQVDNGILDGCGVPRELDDAGESNNDATVHDIHLLKKIPRVLEENVFCVRFQQSHRPVKPGCVEFDVCERVRNAPCQG